MSKKENKRNQQQPKNSRTTEKNINFVRFGTEKLYLRDLYSSLIGRRISIDRFWSIDWVLFVGKRATHTHSTFEMVERPTKSESTINFLLGWTCEAEWVKESASIGTEFRWQTRAFLFVSIPFIWRSSLVYVFGNALGGGGGGSLHLSAWPR